MLSAVSSKDIKPLKKGGRVREQHKALHLPKKEYDKTETTVVANNEDSCIALYQNQYQSV